MKRLMGAVTIGQMRFNATPSIDRVTDTAALSTFLCDQAAAIADELGSAVLETGRKVVLPTPHTHPWFAAMWGWQAFRSARSEPKIQDAHRMKSTQKCSRVASVHSKLIGCLPAVSRGYTSCREPTSSSSKTTTQEFRGLRPGPVSCGTDLQLPGVSGGP